MDLSGLFQKDSGLNTFHNALQSGLDTFGKGMNAAYLPQQLQSNIQKMQAESASKLAYANLMGPQFLAKLMGNQDILANIPDQQKKQSLDMLLQSGSGQSLNNEIPNKGKSLVDSLMDLYHDKVKVDDQLSDQKNNSQPVIQKDSTKDAIAAWLKTPEAVEQKEKNGQITIPDKEKLMNWYNNQSPNSSFTGNPTNSFAENVANYKGIVKEGEESGTIRAKDISELNNSVFIGKTNETTLNDLSDILASPEFEQIRQLPLAQQHELAFYAKEGTKKQQDMIGRYYTLTGNIIKDSSRDFAGQFRTGEQKLLEGMKPNPSDTIDTAKGKTESLAYLNKMLTERSKITSELMSNYHMNKLQASTLADQKVNGAAIRRQIQDRLNPKPTDDDINFMAQKYKISPDEVKQKLKAKGIL